MFAARRRTLVRWFVALLPVVLLTALMQPAAGASPALDAVGPTAGELGKQWTATHDGPQKYPNIHIEWDVPITMSDGTVLKANVYRPADAGGGPVAEPTPTIVNLIPYTKLLSMITQTGTSIPGFSEHIIEFFRNFDMTGTPFDGLTDVTRMLGGGMIRSFAADPALIKSGYTQVIVDVRGTGFSQGEFKLFQEREQKDTLEVIDWASNQSWSNGKIGMSGVSYSAINQLKAAEEHPAALKALFPVQPGGDLLRDLIAPGGGTGIGFIGPLLVFAINLPKLLPDVMSIVQGRFDWQWLKDRQASPMTLVPEGLAGLTTPSVDQLSPELKKLVDPDGSLRQGWIGHAEKVKVPTMMIGGWHDIFANSEPEIYNAIPLPPGKKQLIMGDNYHGMAGFAMRGPEYGEPPRIDVLQRAWFDHWLKGIDNGIETYGPVTLWQQGNGWTTTDQFPRAGVEHRKMYLSPAPSGTGGHSLHDGSLTSQKPTETAKLTVAPGLKSVCSRDATQITMGILGITGCGEDERFHEEEGLTFTSAPVSSPTEISGPISVHLNTVHQATDGYWTVTVNDVAPDGRSTVLTTGQLVSSLRKVDDSRSERSANGAYTDPFHPLTLESMLPVEPGKPIPLDIAVIPTDAVLAPGHRLRIDVFASNWPKGQPLGPMLVGSQLAPQQLLLDPNEPSYVNIPIDGKLN